MNPVQKFGTVTEDFLFNEVCGSVYNGIQLPTVTQVKHDIKLKVQAAENTFKENQLATNHEPRAVVQKFREGNPTTCSTPYLDQVLHVIGADLDAGYTILDNSERKWNERLVFSTLRSKTNPHYTYNTNCFAVQIRKGFPYRDLWESNDYVLSSEPLDKELILIDNVGDWTDPDTQEDI